MKKMFLLNVIIGLFLPILGKAENKILFSCTLEDPWLQKQNMTGNLVVYKNLENAELKLTTPQEEIICPLSVDSLQDASRAVVALANFKFSAQSCTPEAKKFNKNLRPNMTLKVSTQPGVPPEAAIAWRVHTGFSKCKETKNNLKDLGVGSRLPLSNQNKKNKSTKNF